MIELIPNRGPCLAANKVSDESGFAAARVGGDHRDGTAEVGLQLFGKPRALQ
jgi:hypothetical protein